MSKSIHLTPHFKIYLIFFIFRLVGHKNLKSGLKSNHLQKGRGCIGKHGKTLLLYWQCGWCIEKLSLSLQSQFRFYLLQSELIQISQFINQITQNINRIPADFLANYATIFRAKWSRLFKILLHKGLKSSPSAFI